MFLTGLLQLPFVWLSAVNNISSRVISSPSQVRCPRWAGAGELNSHREKEMQPRIRDICFGLFNEVFDVIRLHAKFPEEFPAEATESSVRIYHLPVPE